MNRRRLPPCIFILLVGSSVFCAVATKAYSAPYRAPVKAIPAVIDEFDFISGFGADAKLAHLATQAFVQELNRGIDGPELKSLYKIDALPLTVAPGSLEVNPFKEGPQKIPLEVLKAAGAQHADCIITGAISEVQFVRGKGNGHTRRARVVFSVLVTNVVTKELENGSVAAGYSVPPPDGEKAPSDDTMLAQAVLEAAKKNAENIQNYRMPSATVLDCNNKEAVLDRGENDGLCVGTDLVIVKDQKVLGRLRLSKVGKSRSWAKVLFASGRIKIGDIAQSILRLPS